EFSAALQGGWHCEARYRVGRDVVEVILGEKEEQPCPASIEVRAGDQDGTADGSTGILKPVTGFRLSGGVVEPFVGIELLMPHIVVQTAVEVPGASFDCDVDQPALPRPVLRGVVSHL